MKVAHAAVVTPRRCGLYETTREVVVGLRALGVDSRIIDPTGEKNTLHPGTDDDRGAPLADVGFAHEADVLVSHSGLGELEDIGKPIIHVAHGRPKSSFLTETTGGTPIYSYGYHKNKEKKFRAVVTFWPEHVPYLRSIYADTPVKCDAARS